MARSEPNVVGMFLGFVVLFLFSSGLQTELFLQIRTKQALSIKLFASQATAPRGLRAGRLRARRATERFFSSELEPGICFPFFRWMFLFFFFPGGVGNREEWMFSMNGPKLSKKLKVHFLVDFGFRGV